MRPNRSTVALTADSASAGLVMSSFTTNRSADFPRALATLSVLRPVATTLWPAARAALAISTPIPRPAPVISQTLLMSLLLNNDPSNGSVGVDTPTQYAAPRCAPSGILPPESDGRNVALPSAGVWK